MHLPSPGHRERIDVSSLEEVASDDTEVLAKICQIDTWQYGGMSLDLRKIQNIFRGGCTSFYAARSGREIVAYAMIHFFDSTPKAAKLGRLVVHPELRRARIATQLLFKWSENDGPRGCVVLNADTPIKNVGGRRFLEAFGFDRYYYDYGQHEPRAYFQWKITQ